MAVAMRDKWTDERLDDLKGSVDGGFSRVDQRFDRVDARFDKLDKRIDRIEGKIDTQLGRIDGGIDGISRAIIFAGFTLSGAMLTGFIAIFTLIATRL
jgi:tetrahydromethanopterin S-methyltransferase subunit G